MKLSEKAVKIKKILDDKFPQFEGSLPLCDRGQPWILVCYCNLTRIFAIDTTAEEITESLIRDRLLDMLWEAKHSIEVDIEKLENGGKDDKDL